MKKPSKSTTKETRSMKLSNEAYDLLKWVVGIVIPAVSAFYFGISQIFSLPYGLEVTGTLALLATFIGALVGISTKNFNAENNDPDA